MQQWQSQYRHCEIYLSSCEKNVCCVLGQHKMMPRKLVACWDIWQWKNEDHQKWEEDNATTNREWYININKVRDLAVYNEQEATNKLVNLYRCITKMHQHSIEEESRCNSIRQSHHSTSQMYYKNISMQHRRRIKM